MATTVDELIVQIKTDTKDLQNGLGDIRKRLDGMDKSTNRSIVTFQRLGGILAALGIAQIGRSIINTSRTFEDLGATLRAITGSAEAAAVSMDLITKFTATTTFQLDSVTGAFTTLLNAGITPTTDVLQDFGNVAAAFNKDITTMAQAAFNATTGEMEMLKQFGIIAKVEGDKLAVTFDGTTKTIERDASSIVNFIRDIGREKFPTALEERAKTVSGAFSNLEDATSLLFKSVGESGLNEALTELALGLIDVVDAMQPLGRNLGKAINVTFEKLGDAIAIVKRNMDELLGAFSIYIGYQIAARTIQAGQAMVLLAGSLTKAGVAMQALNRLSKGNFLIIGAILLAGLTGALDDVTEKVIEVGSQLANMLGLSDIFGDMSADTEELSADLETLNNQLISMVGAGSAAGNALDELKENAKSVEEEIEAMNESIIASTQQMTLSFVNSLMEGQSALASFRDFAKNIVAQIIATFLNMLIVNRILNAIFQPFGMAPLPTMSIGSIGAGGSAGGVTGATAYGTGPAPPPIVRTPLGGLASGGSVNAGTPYLVGERGPELFMPNTGGTIRNGADTRRAMTEGGGIVVNQTINLSAGVVGTVRAEVQRMMPQIADVTKLGVLEATRRGGAYRKGLLGS
jgi:hypothetical protein